MISSSRMLLMALINVAMVISSSVASSCMASCSVELVLGLSSSSSSSMPTLTRARRNVSVLGASVAARIVRITSFLVPSRTSVLFTAMSQSSTPTVPNASAVPPGTIMDTTTPPSLCHLGRV